MEHKLTSQTPSTYEGSFKTIVIIGLIAGTLDLTTAIIVSGVNPITLLQYIASGAFGAEKAFSGGLMMAFWGVIFHYFIAFSWTVLFFFAYPALKFLQKNKYITGLLYGLFVWIIMNLIIVPLSQIPPRPFNITGALKQASILMVMIGLPISILTHRFYSKRK